MKIEHKNMKPCVPYYRYRFDNSSGYIDEDIIDCGKDFHLTSDVEVLLQQRKWMKIKMNLLGYKNCGV